MPGAPGGEILPAPVADLRFTGRRPLFIETFQAADIGILRHHSLTVANRNAILEFPRHGGGRGIPFDVLAPTA